PAKAASSSPRGWATPPPGKEEGRKKSDPKAQKRHVKDKENFNKVQPQRKRPEVKKPVPHPTTNVKSVQIPERITVKEFAQAIEVSVSEVIKKLIGLGVMATINQEIDLDTAILVGAEFNVTVEKAPTEEETLLIEEIEDSPESLKPRWPVVTIMGHVDHGKTSLLDAIRQTNVIASEAGGITQHIGAYQVEINDKKITFLDTPGHEAFTAMRARGAQVTDIAVLVVAADDGVMPQTVEAINHGKAADVPIIVAINKIDKPTANPDRVKQELTQYGLVPEEWGGDTICVEVSALKKQGLEELLEMILLVAEVRELKANPDRPAKGTVIEAKLDKGRGPVATVLVQNGTLKQGDTIIAGEVSGKVRALVNDKGKTVKKAGPSIPVEVVGFDDLPEAGDIFYVTDEKIARHLADRRQQFRREQSLKREQRFKLEDLFARIKEGEMKELNIVLKADVQGSVEAIQSSLERLSNEEVRVKVIHGGVGAISESDVMLASASGAIIVGFNVRPDPIAKRLAEREDVDVRLYRIIYDIVDDVKKAMEGMLEPEYREVVLGRAEVRATFKVPKVGTVAGCYVTEGKITRNSEARVLRDNVVVFEGKIISLKRFKDDVREVASGFECGIGLERFNDVKEGDVIEAFTSEAIKKVTSDDSLK
ncbi:MAG: translation initiation factor IF-2, partial [Firmicutes bacterium]|nr:translation initiation factor IF-2 [Bacillota bacterium]